MKSKVLLRVKGKNINRFIKRLKNNKIDILDIRYINTSEVNIVLNYKDYSKALKVKSIYEIDVTDVYGFLKVKKRIKRSIHILGFLVFAFLFFFLLTNTVFDIEVIHSNKEIRNLIKDELYKNGIKRFSFKKSYDDISKIKEKIINKYPDKIEWLEIISDGTKYVVKAEERKINNSVLDNRPRNIIAKKSGVIKKVIANEGEIIRDMDDYVSKGDLIISGDIIFNDEVKGKVRASGKVYAEIWYLTKVSYPFVISKKVFTGREKDVLVFSFLNKRYEFSFNKFKCKDIKENKIIYHRFLPIKLAIERQKEEKIVNHVLTYDEALNKAKMASEEEIKDKLNKDEYIINSTYLKSDVNNSTIEVEMFFAVYEDITDYVEIGE